MSFLDDDYLLETDAARELYAAIEDLPIIDPHTHADVAEIVDNDGWDDIWEVEAATDHYVWALMRNCGIDEDLITGDADNREKWNVLAEVFPQFAGNPTYEWVHLDLKRRFGIDEQISAETADEIWAETKSQLETDDMRPQQLLAEMDVEVVGSTDDPTDDLEYHERAAEELEGVDLVPTWRADRAVKIDQPEWTDFVAELEDATEISTDDFDGFLAALEASHDYFDARGCRACDLGLEQPVSRPVSDERAREVYQQALAGGSLSEREVGDFMAYITAFVGELNAEKSWVTQLHIGPVRNYRNSLFEQLGPAAGGDISTQDVDIVKPLEHFVNRFDDEMDIILYTIDPTHYPSMATMARVFPNVTIGPAWWFNDSPFGMEQQLEYVGTVELLSQHAGMVSDSRKLLSYGSRFEMFRRSLANVVGKQVERGQVPMDVAQDLVERLAYDRPNELYEL
ncbi:glucuronate isomerase [Natronolimnobius sp. AArcel1]|uniref:glucuronate isomerase n=1 Tax=Natronolimnobius sp. AArcel1 TaxID=1679093 RepID=UPI0013E9D188|nr:glucuronate isomerase [Natronolimnobius sp. AArcel1]NGM69811.1 glucuronate isomerase [Natronolimnobius sp. AArcel1]